jgi:hypothetical protein
VDNFISLSGFLCYRGSPWHVVGMFPNFADIVAVMQAYLLASRLRLHVPALRPTAGLHPRLHIISSLLMDSQLRHSQFSFPPPGPPRFRSRLPDPCGLCVRGRPQPPSEPALSGPWTRAADSPTHTIVLPPTSRTHSAPSPSLCLVSTRISAATEENQT